MACLARDMEMGVCDGCFVGHSEWCMGRGGIPKDKRAEVAAAMRAYFTGDKTPRLEKPKEASHE